jgi:hypothetical protein
MLFEAPEGKEIALKFSGNKVLLAICRIQTGVIGKEDHNAHQVLGWRGMTYARDIT